MTKLRLERAGRIVRPAIKITIMTALLVLIAKQISWRDYEVLTVGGELQKRPGLASCLDAFAPRLFLVAVLLQFASLACSAMRWRLLALVQGINLGRQSAMSLTFLGEFFNHLLPGAVGGDFAKAYYLIRHNGNAAGAIASIFVSRFVGVITLISLASAILVGMVASGEEFSGDLKFAATAIPLTLALILSVTVLFMNGRLMNSRILKSIAGRLPFAKRAVGLQEAFILYRRVVALWFPVFYRSICTVLFYVMSVMLVGLSLGVSVPWHHYFVYIPLVTLMSSLPLTPGGVGVFEELLLFFLARPGEESKVLLMALFCRLILLICSLPGGVIFLFDKKTSIEGISSGHES